MKPVLSVVRDGIGFVRGVFHRADLLVLGLIALVLAIFLIDNDAPNPSLNTLTYVVFACALLSVPLTALVLLRHAVALGLCAAFLIYELLTPVWTGGMEPAAWRHMAVMSAWGFAFACVVALAVADRWKLLRWVPLVVALAAMGVTAFSMWRYLGPHGMRLLDPRLMTFPWPNPNTGSAVLGLVVAGLIFFPARQLFPIRAAMSRLPTDGAGGAEALAARLCLAGLVVLILADILLAGTRSALVALAVSGLAYMVLTARRRAGGRNLVIGAVLVVLAVAMLLVGLHYGSSSLVLRPSTGLRDTLLIGFWKIASEALWLGHGIQNEYKFSVEGVTAPHNQLLTVLLYGGMGAVVLYGALYLRLFYVGLVYFYRTGCFALASIVIYLVIHGMFETVIITSYPGWRWLYIWAPIGLAAGLEMRLKAQRQRPT